MMGHVSAVGASITPLIDLLKGRWSGAERAVETVPTLGTPP